MFTADTTARPDGPEERPVETRHASKSNGDPLLGSFVGTLIAAAVAALALWPHVRTLFD